ncbi:MAG: tetratricopeptide repeat protein [Moraxella sp.]|nr:tetratricopeptide repeat protein [Moraxella sp.]
MNDSFVWFEFDHDVALLWQSLTEPTPKNTFAYQAKLRQLVQNSPVWGSQLDTLKLLDVFLSAVKSDLAGRNIKEHELVSHPEFVKLLMVLSYHVAQVLRDELGAMADVKMECYANSSFGRVYARTFAHSQAPALSEMELADFYQGLGYLVQATTASGVAVAQSFFVLSVIGARLFGSLERTFRDLDAQGNPSRMVEDSLYWAVADFVQKMPNLTDDNAKKLFITPAKTASVVADLGEVVDDVAKAVNVPDDMSVIPKNEPVPTLTPDETSKPVAPISQRKQKARASHTPKLFDEVYQDLKNLSTTHDGDPTYQKAKMVLDKIDEYIAGELKKGKALADIEFSDNATQAYNQAIQLLTVAAKQGNLSAMTRLAVYLFEGRGVPANIATATNLIKRTAEAGDIRAQKLLSRLYYQGFAPDDGGVAMSVEMGELWLGKSADGGHPEAKKVRAYMKQVETLKSDYRTELQSDKRYLMWGVVIIGGLVLILLLMMVMF